MQTFSNQQGGTVRIHINNRLLYDHVNELNHVPHLFLIGAVYYTVAGQTQESTQAVSCI